MRADGDAGESTSGLVIADGWGRYFVIAWDELERYSIPAAYAELVTALARGGESVPSPRDLRGFANFDAARPSERLAATLLDAVAAQERPALRRLEAWAIVP